MKEKLLLVSGPLLSLSTANSIKLEPNNSEISAWEVEKTDPDITERLS